MRKKSKLCRFGIHKYKDVSDVVSFRKGTTELIYDGFQICERCGKARGYLYDSQGGSWTTFKGIAHFHLHKAYRKRIDPIHRDLLKVSGKAC